MAYNSPAFNDDPFARVDQATDPARFVHYLAAQEADPLARRVKAASYHHLNPLPGMHVLDCGCGLGMDVRALAALVGPTGAINGIDNSTTMLAAARERTPPDAGPITFQLADITALPFADNTFDGVRGERVLQHLADPLAALREMVRVAKPGAPIVCVDHDAGILFEDLPDMASAERLRLFRMSAIAQPYVGRQLFRLMQAAGIGEVSVEPFTQIYTAGSAEFYFAALAEATAAGAITSDEQRALRDVLTDWFAAGYICYGTTLFVAAGNKPLA